MEKATYEMNLSSFDFIWMQKLLKVDIELGGM